jgi:hypothetical protein
MTQPVEYEQVGYNSPGGVQIAKSASDLVGFYGKVPVVQRAYSSAVHASSALASSGSFGATQLAVVNEIQATLVALGIWATV